MAAFTRSVLQREHDQTLSHRRPDVRFLAGGEQDISTKVGIASCCPYHSTDAPCRPVKPTGAFPEFGYTCGPPRNKRIHGLAWRLGGVSAHNEDVAAEAEPAGRMMDTTPDSAGLRRTRLRRSPMHSHAPPPVIQLRTGRCPASTDVCPRTQAFVDDWPKSAPTPLFDPVGNLYGCQAVDFCGRDREDL